MQPEAVRQGYEPAPFFFVETHESGARRAVAWASSLVTMQQAFVALIEALPDSLEVLLKVTVDEDHAEAPAGEAWQRHYGVVAQGALLEAIERCDTFVFQDSRNQLCVRDPVSFDYIVLDHVGVIYAYSNESALENVLARLGFEQRVEALVGDEGSWSQLPASGAEQEAEFIRLLRLSPVPGPDDDPTDDRSVH